MALHVLCPHCLRNPWPQHVNGRIAALELERGPLVEVHEAFDDALARPGVASPPWGRAESAGINRHRVEGVSPLHERRSCSIMAPSHASAIREEAAKR